jgi:hypothetical protein
MAQSRGFGGVCPDAPKRSVFSGYGDSLISLQFYPVIFRCAIERFGDKAHPNVYKTVVLWTGWIQMSIKRGFLGSVQGDRILIPSIDVD